MEVVEICEFRFNSFCSSLVRADNLLFSIFNRLDVGKLRVCKFPPGLRDSWCGIGGGDDEYWSEGDAIDWLFTQAVASFRG